MLRLEGYGTPFADPYRPLPSLTVLYRRSTYRRLFSTVVSFLPSLSDASDGGQMIRIRCREDVLPIGLGDEIEIPDRGRVERRDDA